MDKTYDIKPTDAKKFLTRLCENLGISDQYILDAYNDPLVALLQEAQFPIDIDPLKVDLKDSWERKALAESLSKGLNTPCGFASTIGFSH